MTHPHRRVFAGFAVAALALWGCSDPATSPVPAPARPSLAVSDAGVTGYSQYLAEFNHRVIGNGGRAVAARAELLLASNAPARTPNIIFANDRALRLDTRWVAGDLRRLATDATLTYDVFAPWASATIGGNGEAAFDASFATWNAVSCSNLAVVKKALSPGRLPSYLLTGGLFPPADMNDVGFLPASLFDLVFGPGTSQFTVGVTLIFSFIEVDTNGQPVLDEDGNPIPTDIDRDGHADTAFTETWFNDGFAYATDGAPGRIDIETVALHEHGHALGLDHFGRISGDPKTGKLHVSPRAVMNAILLGVLRAPLGTDVAALCGTYASWP